jgi:hypothetical protein
MANLRCVVISLFNPGLSLLRQSSYATESQVHSERTLDPLSSANSAQCRQRLSCWPAIAIGLLETLDLLSQQSARTSESGHWRQNIRSPIVSPMRLKSSIWVAAYLRRCQTEGVFGAVRRRGAEEAGAVFIKVTLLDGNAMLYVPAPQTVYDDSRPIERFFMPSSLDPVTEASVEERLAREIRFDPDAWIVETEDRAGRHFLDLARA